MEQFEVQDHLNTKEELDKLLATISAKDEYNHVVNSIKKHWGPQNLNTFVDTD